MADDISHLLDAPSDPRAMVGKAVVNLPGSIARQAGGVVKSALGMIPQPSIDAQGNMHQSVPTLEAISHVLAGLIGPHLGVDVSPESKAAAGALIDHYKHKYGTKQGFLDAFQNDPASIAMDVASIAAPIEGGLKTAGMLAEGAGLARTSSILQRAGSVAADVSDATNPLVASAKGISKATAPARTKIAQGLYESSLRETPRHGDDIIPGAAAQGIASGVPANWRGGGVAKKQLWNAMEGPQHQVDQGIDYYTNQGFKVDLGDVVQKNVGPGLPPHLRDNPGAATMADYKGAGPVYSQYVGPGLKKQHQAIDDTIGEAAAGHGTPVYGPPPVPQMVPSSVLGPNGQPIMTQGPQLPTPRLPNQLGPRDFDAANAIAKKGYRDTERLSKSSSFDERTAPSIDTNKAISAGIRRDMKEQAEAARATDPNAPDIATPLKQQSNLMALDDLMNPTATDTSAAVRTIPMGGVYAGMRAVTSPAVKTRAAIALSPKSPMFNNSRVIPGIKMTTGEVARATAGQAATTEPLQDANAEGKKNINNPPAPPDISHILPDISDYLANPPTAPPPGQVPQFADGATVQGPTPALVGEAGPELIKGPGPQQELVNGPQIRTLGAQGTQQVVPLTAERAPKTPQQIEQDEQQRLQGAMQKLDKEYQGYGKKNKWPIPPGTLSDEQQMQYNQRKQQLQGQFQARLKALQASQAVQTAATPGPKYPSFADGGKILPSDEDVIRGSTNIPLAPDGEMQAQKLANDMPGLFNKIYYSPLVRGQQTAQVLAQTNPQAGPPQPKPGLVPWNLGSFEGQPTKNVINIIHHYLESNPDVPIPGAGIQSGTPGESFNTFRQRGIGAFQELLNEAQQNPTARIAAITHYRDVKLAKAWAKAGGKPDGEIAPNEMISHAGGSDDTGSIHHLGTGPDGKLAVTEVKPSQNLGAGVFLIRHGKTAWNGPSSAAGVKTPGARVKGQS